MNHCEGAEKSRCDSGLPPHVQIGEDVYLVLLRAESPEVLQGPGSDSSLRQKAHEHLVQTEGLVVDGATGVEGREDSREDLAEHLPPFRRRRMDSRIITTAPRGGPSLHVRSRTLPHQQTSRCQGEGPLKDHRLQVLAQVPQELPKGPDKAIKEVGSAGRDPAAAPLHGQLADQMDQQHQSHSEGPRPVLRPQTRGLYVRLSA